MSARVSTLLNVGPNGGRYVFMLIPWCDYANALRDEWNRQSNAFGMDLGSAGLVVESYPERQFQIAEEVGSKQWPEEIRERFTDDGAPMLLVIDRDWVDFDPLADPYAIVWLSDTLVSDVRPLLQTLARLTRNGDDVIDYLKGVAERQRKRKFLAQVFYGAGRIAKAASYVEIKPSVFGVSLDISAFLRDIADSAKRGQ